MKPKNVEAFLKAVPPDLRAVLLFGPDEGQVRERARQLALTIVSDLNDPFNVVELTQARILEDAALVADELAAQSLMGGRRLVRLRGAEDSAAPSIQNAFVRMTSGDSFLIVEAGELRPTSPLRKLFEGADVAAALACYESDVRDRIRLAEQAFREAGITVSRDAINLLANLLASDRGVAQQEIGKLITYAGNGKKIDFDDVVQATGDSATLDLDEAAWAAGEGNLPRLDRSLTRLFADGLPSITVLRAAQRHFMRLYQVVGSPQPLPVAMDELKPPVFWKDKERFAAQASRWRRGQLEKVLQRLTQAEIECKTTGLRDQTMCARALAAIAGAASR